MDLVLTEDQALIAKTAADFVKEKSPVARMRALRDANDATGYSRALWKEMAELGWVGLAFPENLGGAGLGFAELAVVLEELGRTLAPEPFLGTVLLGGQALLLGGSDAQKQAWLPKLCAGDAIVTLAHQEARSRYDLNHVETRAERAAGGWKLRGEKIQVLDGHVADALLIPARTSGAVADAAGISLFLVTKGAAGLAATRQSRVDSRGAALVKLDGVAGEPVGAEGAAGELLARVVDRATIGLCAEMLGGMQQAFALTLEHLKTRKQFDVPIGSFQALKHRAADVFIELELAKSAVMAAARAVDENSPELAKLASLAKAKCSDAYLLAAHEGVQMFGGVGMTDEYDIGLYLKRARAAELTFGDAAFHRAHWASLNGY
ncbi:MAG TPA: acyl-CoA dehydrogenase family protein [Myxococcota bacterium]|nr:acyl-CoA dehydrogenase family protein [Myxococcota bacterium]